MRSVVVDSNLLVLLVVGSAGLNLIHASHHTKGFDPADLDVLVERIGAYSGIVLLPGILAETSSPARKNITEPGLYVVMSKFRALIEASVEASVPAITAARRHEFNRLGFVDASILQLCMDHRDELALMTYDQPLAREATRLGIAVNAFQDWQ